jgi:hypothetical protein
MPQDGGGTRSDFEAGDSVCKAVVATTHKSANISASDMAAFNADVPIVEVDIHHLEMVAFRCRTSQRIWSADVLFHRKAGEGRAHNVTQVLRACAVRWSLSGGGLSFMLRNRACVCLSQKPTSV